RARGKELPFPVICLLEGRAISCFLLLFLLIKKERKKEKQNSIVKER
ncbi:unnamed protein product, partial [Gulo gulo]